MENESPVKRWSHLHKKIYRPDQVWQTGNTRDMIHPILPLIAYMSRFFTLRPGDIVLTGTPEGVAALKPGDALTVSLNQHQLSTRII
ncbi:hypothetical protein SODG_004419 [Sodalis praecaptivus]|uniref:fumarylacetoacetate hydrolase family protein n=1 Tax=Sodalis praecaptivus TaxID=1239307 RepID=UPI0027FAE2B6|nr:fumarylacetoacetate hydrolase family protein [Sodalis praecaptivus]CAJ0992318.1 hypothetical protein NVIRENTERO_00587 [Sodalis praecaptivus]